MFFFLFFFNDTATTEIYTLSLHDALPIFIINHDTRKIEHFGVTYNPNTIWLKQQFREATPFDDKPQYLIHDNRSEEHTSELQSRPHLVCRLLLEKKKKNKK